MVGLKVVVQGAVLVVLSDEQHLRPRPCAFNVGGYEAQYVVVSHEHGLVNFRLPEPGLFLGGVKYFDGNLLSSPFRLPHLPVPPFAHRTDHLYLFGDGPLHQKRQPGAGSAGLLDQVVQWLPNLDVGVRFSVEPLPLHFSSAVLQIEQYRHHQEYRD